MIIKEIANYVAKGIWLLIEREGKMTPAEIKAAGYLERTVFNAWAYLSAGGFVIKLQAGLYAVNGSESTQRNIFKTKERKEENFKEENSGKKTTANLSEFVAQIPVESWQSVRDEAARHFKERNISPDLVDRIAFAVGMKFPEASKADYDEIISDAEERRRDGKIKYRWIHMNNEIRKVYEKAGWEWTPCRSSREVWIDVQHETQRAKKTGAAG